MADISLPSREQPHGAVFNKVESMFMVMILIRRCHYITSIPFSLTLIILIAIVVVIIVGITNSNAPTILQSNSYN